MDDFDLRDVQDFLDVSKKNTRLQKRLKDMPFTNGSIKYDAKLSDENDSSVGEDFDSEDIDSPEKDVYEETERSSLRIPQMGKDYAGKRVSRKDLEQQDNENESETGNEDELMLDGSSDGSLGLNDDLGDFDLEEEEDDLQADISSKDKRSITNGNGKHDTLSSPSISEDGSELDEDEEQDSDDSETSKENKSGSLAALVAEQARRAAEVKASDQAQDYLKGEAIIRQQKVYEKLLDIRIKLQKVLVALKQNESEIDKSSRIEAKRHTRRLLVKLHQKRRRYVQNVCDIELADINESTMFHTIKDQDEIVKDWREENLNFWSQKTAKSITKSFKALRVPTIVEQIEENTKNKLKKYESSSTSLDDTEFYQALLKSLIDSKLLKGADVVIPTVAPKKKKRENVDVKASKGRRLRYDVHEKIINFMAPQPGNDWHEEKIDHLFRNLLDQGTKDKDEEIGLQGPTKMDIQLFS